MHHVKKSSDFIPILCSL